MISLPEPEFPPLWSGDTIPALRTAYTFSFSHLVSSQHRACHGESAHTILSPSPSLFSEPHSLSCFLLKLRSVPLKALWLKPQSSFATCKPRKTTDPSTHRARQEGYGGHLRARTSWVRRLMERIISRPPP